MSYIQGSEKYVGNAYLPMKNGDYGYYSARNQFRINPMDSKTMSPSMKVFMSRDNVAFLKRSLDTSLQDIYGSKSEGAADYFNRFNVPLHWFGTEMPSLLNLANFQYLSMKQMNLYAMSYFLKLWEKRLQTYAERPRKCSNFLDSQTRAMPPNARRKTRHYFRIV